MHIVSTSSAPAASLSWRSRGGITHTVVCKATYDLVPGRSTLAVTQDPIHDRDQFWDDDEQRSLRAPSDLAPFKRRADVIVVGSIFPPNQAPSRRVVARLMVGEIDKSIAAYSDRWATRNNVIEEGKSWTRMPLSYERAAGGEESDNPVGRIAARDGMGKLALPNLMPPAFEPQPPDFFVPSIGFGPIAASWPARVRKLGAHAALSPEALLERPEEFESSYFNVAPADQQLDDLPSDCRIALENLHPQHPTLATTLPGHRARALCDLASIDIELVCDTLLIDTDRQVCTLTWRGSFWAESFAADERVIVALETPDARTSADALRRSIPSGESTMTLMARPRVHAPLPFSQNAPGANTPSRPAPELAGTPFQAARVPREVAPALAGIASTALGTQQLPDPPASMPTPPRGALAPMAPPPPPPAPVQGLAPPPPVMRAAPPPPATLDASPTRGAVPPPKPSSPQLAQLPAYMNTPVAPGPVVIPTHDPRAASRGVASASDAAARVDPPPRPPTEAPEPKVQQKRVRSFVDLLWYDPAAVERVRGQVGWTDALKEPAKSGRWLTDAAALEASKADIEPVRFIARALTRVATLDVAGVHRELLAGVDDDGFLVRPLVVVEGDVAMAYDPAEALHTSIALAEPLAVADKKLKDALDQAADIAKSDRPSTVAMIESALGRVRAAFAAANKVYPAQFLETTTERILIEERRYQKRTVFGAPKLVGTLHLQPAGSFPLYLPDALTSTLPLLPRFRARVIAEPHPRQDLADPEGTVLLVLAIGRVVVPPSAG